MAAPVSLRSRRTRQTCSNVGATRVRSWTALVDGEDKPRLFPSSFETLLVLAIEADQDVEDESGLERRVVG